ncbi:MAG: hypothetical protein AAGE84_08510 [Cyanobacteria bacterium P01_G01_bin.39]
MSNVKRIQTEIEALAPEDFVRLREWFAEKDWILWDKQLESDIANGKLEFLLKEAITAKAQEKLQDL